MRRMYVTQRRLQVLRVLMDARGFVSRAYVVQQTGIHPNVVHRALLALVRQEMTVSLRMPGLHGHLVYILTPSGREEADHLLSQKG